jgi:hypothetical protein
MKTNRFIPAFITLIFTVFLSYGSIANTYASHNGDLTATTANKNTAIEKSTDSETVSYTNAEQEYSYLHFNVNDYASYSEIEEVIPAMTDRYRFDVTDFVNDDNSYIPELPVVEEFEYLRFDTNHFVNETACEIDELPLTE